MKSKGSILILVFLMLVVTVLGRMVKVSQEKITMQAWSQRQIELLRVTEAENQLEVVKNENAILKKQVSSSYRDKVVVYIRQVFGKKATEALAVVKCENASMDMARVNYNRDNSYDVGPFQINSIHIKRFGTAFMKDYKENIKVAYALFKEQSWRPWYSSNNCHKLAYVN